MKRRTHEDNRQLARDEIQVEDIKGAVSVCKTEVHGIAKGVQITCVRGWSGRKAQMAVLSREGVDALIEELVAARNRVFGEG